MKQKFESDRRRSLSQGLNHFECALVKEVDVEIRSSE